MKTPKRWLDHYYHFYPELERIEAYASQWVHNRKKAVYPYQAAALYHYARSYDGGEALEIGTCFGYSGYYLAQAMPNSRIVTLNTSLDEIAATRDSGIFSGCPNVEMVNAVSWDYRSEDEVYNFIFVDGDHNQVALDIPYFNRLTEGGLILFHDYSPYYSTRPCPPVFDAVNEMSGQLKRLPDVMIIDSDFVGLAGFRRREGERIDE